MNEWGGYLIAFVVGSVISLFLEWLIIELPRRIKRKKQAEVERKQRKQTQLRDTQTNLRNRFHNWFLNSRLPLALTFKRIDHSDGTTSDLIVRRSNLMLFMDIEVNLAYHHKEEQIHVRFYGRGKLRDEAFSGDENGFNDAVRHIDAMLRYVIVAQDENR